MTDNTPPTPAVLTRTYTYVCQMDNHEPARTFAHGTLEVWTWPDSGEETYKIPDGLNTFLSRGTHTVFLLDDGRTVIPVYVTGWSPKSGHVSLAPLPVNVNADGTPRMRADQPERPVDYAGWTLGPARAYHLKIQETTPDADDAHTCTDEGGAETDCYGCAQEV